MFHFFSKRYLVGSRKIIIYPSTRDAQTHRSFLYRISRSRHTGRITRILLYNLHITGQPTTHTSNHFLMATSFRSKLKCLLVPTRTRTSHGHTRLALQCKLSRIYFITHAIRFVFFSVFIRYVGGDFLRGIGASRTEITTRGINFNLLIAFLPVSLSLMC
jgi:hypothetical protein